MGNQFKIFKTLFATLTLLALFACGDDDGKATITNNEDTGGGSSGGGSPTDSLIYASIQTVTSKGTAAYSNEIQIPGDSSGQLSVTWEEPTRTISGDCLNDTITAYKANIGTESGSYTITQDIALGDVTCTDSGKTDTVCTKNIQNCTFSIDLSGL